MYVGIAVHDLGHGSDQFDDPLGLMVSGRRFAGEDDSPGREGFFRTGFDAVIKRNQVQRAQQLPLVLVYAFDLHIK